MRIQEKTVAFFYINSMGAANVRKSNDYVSKMIELAGGEYIFHDPAEDDNALSTMSTQMGKNSCAKAKDAGCTVYDGTILTENWIPSMNFLQKAHFWLISRL